MGDAEREMLSHLIDRLRLPRMYFDNYTTIADALPLILLAIVQRIEALERARE